MAQLPPRDAARRMAALEAECAGLRRLLDSASAFAIITLDAGALVTEWNDGARRLMGHERAAMLGRPGQEVLPADTRADGVFRRLLRLAAEQGQAPIDCWIERRDGSRFWASGMMMPLRDAAGQPAGFLKIFRDCTAQRVAAEHQELLQAEMGHRVKNAMATAQAVAAQTLRHAGVDPDVQQVLVHRLMALAGSHDQLIRDGWQGAALTEVVARVLAPYRRIVTEGPPVRLPAALVELLSLALHELATNAAKHGALSVQDGRVDLRWVQRRDGAARQVEMLWRESGGPPVLAPRRQGFGSRLLQRGLLQRCGGAIALEFKPTGVECRITLPLAGA